MVTRNKYWVYKCERIEDRDHWKYNKFIAATDYKKSKFEEATALYKNKVPKGVFPKVWK